MKVLEIVHVRSLTIQVASLRDQIIQSIRSASDDQPEVVTIFYRKGLSTDLAVHIQSDDESVTMHKTELGLRLATALRYHGVVEHTIWYEETNKNSG